MELERVLPVRVRKIFENTPSLWHNLQEIRLGAGQPVFLRYGGMEKQLAEEPISQMELAQMLERAMQYSLFAYEEQLAGGFVTLKGGHRLGVAGEARTEKGKLSFRNICYVNLRVAHEVQGCAGRLRRDLAERESRFPNTVLVSPPGCGKTTMLRDLIRILSDEGAYVSLVDERGEVAAAYQGIPQLAVGCRTTVMSGCEKALGMELCVRSMGPEIVAADEIGSKKEFEEITYAMHSGCRLLCTMHAATPWEAFEKGIPPTFTVVLLQQKEGIFSYEVISPRSKKQVEVGELEGKRLYSDSDSDDSMVFAYATGDGKTLS